MVLGFQLLLADLGSLEDLEDLASPADLQKAPGGLLDPDPPVDLEVPENPGNLAGQLDLGLLAGLEDPADLQMALGILEFPADLEFRFRLRLAECSHGHR